MSKRILEGIEPFNNFFYKSCFYNSLFSICQWCDISILPCLVNDVAIYKLGEEQELMLEFLSSKSTEQVLENMGLKGKIKWQCNDIIKNIENAILNGNPVIIWIDCFFESIRPTEYLKNHWPHTLLVYGYDNEEKLFNVIEHRYRETLSYEKRLITYEDVINSVEGYVNNFQKNLKIHSYYEFYCNLSKPRNLSSELIKQILSCFKHNLIGNSEQIFNGIESLKAYKHIFTEIVSDEVILNNNMDYLLQTLNSIINTKEIEMYRIKALLSREKDLFNKLDEIINYWTEIRMVIAKYKYSSVYRLTAMQNCVDTIEKIYNTELEYNKKLLLIL